MPHKKVGCLRMRKQWIPGPFSGPGYEATIGGGGSVCVSVFSTLPSCAFRHPTRGISGYGMVKMDPAPKFDSPRTDFQVGTPRNLIFYWTPSEKFGPPPTDERT